LRDGAVRAAQADGHPPLESRWRFEREVKSAVMTTPVVTETRPQRQSDPPPAAAPAGWLIRASVARIARELDELEPARDGRASPRSATASRATLLDRRPPRRTADYVRNIEANPRVRAMGSLSVSDDAHGNRAHPRRRRPQELIRILGWGNRWRRLRLQTSGAMNTNPLTVRKELAG
jgi:hypothetical protein